MAEYRQFFQFREDWRFDKQQVEALKEYYDANHLLLDCLDRSFPDYDYDVNQVNNKQWEQIEKGNQIYEKIVGTLLLPITEIREIEEQRDIK